MKKVDAYWEKQNFNKKVLEVEFEMDDSLDCLGTLQGDFLNYNYIVAKVPKCKIELLHELEEFGFRFVETQMEMAMNLRKLNKSLQLTMKKVDKLKFEIVNNIEHLERVLAQIDEDLFVTDRISLDPLLGNKIAHKRYINWIRDSFDREDTLIIEVLDKEDRVGFFYFTEKDNQIIQAVLASVYKTFRRRGVGLEFLQQALYWLVEMGYTKATTKVSSNNLEALRANLSVGLEVKGIYYILRKSMG
ncbi:GNAT family N-acetyltransferase [Metasolibacillus meyeri]|uniref:GNAT family N-acetyltransferase n=1 Tax=Metasolibacillus meyeri TaxID=1071052 RepID=UPI000D31D5B3|nr:GNAT family N-acetyltransferase [Metasolibacillus meyeri]